jgi:hypothetical protein
MNGRTRAGRRLSLAVRIAASLAAAVTLVAACSGGSSTGGSGTDTGTVQQLDEYAQCMRSHGVLNFYLSSSGATPPASGTVLSIMGHFVAGVNPRTTAFATAMKACKHLLPGGGPHPVTQQQIQSMVRFAACMRAHGYPSYPDPVVRGGGVIEGLPPGVDTNSPQYQAAEKTCNAST